MARLSHSPRLRDVVPSAVEEPQTCLLAGTWRGEPAHSPDGRRAFAAGVDRTAKLFDLQTGELLADLGEQRKAIMSAEYAPDGKTFVTGGADGVIRI